MIQYKLIDDNIVDDLLVKYVNERKIINRLVGENV